LKGRTETWMGQWCKMHRPTRLVNCANDMHLPPMSQDLQRAVQKRAQPTTRPATTILTFRLLEETRKRQGLRADATRAWKIRHSQARGTIPGRPRPEVATFPSFLADLPRVHMSTVDSSQTGSSAVLQCLLLHGGRDKGEFLWCISTC
jgi:hypothetical protein